MTLRDVKFRLPTRWGDPGESVQLDEEIARQLIASGHAEEIGSPRPTTASIVDQHVPRTRGKGRAQG